MTTALILNGSGKPRGSNSGAFAAYLAKRMIDRGLETETVAVPWAIRKTPSAETLLEAAAKADILALVTPLYVDSLPAAVTRLLEWLAERRATSPGAQRQRLVAVLNCGYPESAHNRTAIAICRQFAVETGIEWVGGIGIGGGEAVAGRPIEKLGRLTRSVCRALDMTADALAEDRPVPDEAIAAAEKPLVPPAIYRTVAWMNWKHRAKEHGAQDQLDARPFDPSDQTDPSD